MHNEKNIAALKARIIELKSQKVCPSCNAKIEEDKVFCPNCGSKVDELVKEEPVQNINRCISCGAELAEGASFCGACGAKQNC